jgi:uncharacterized Zn finger protein
MATTSKDSMDCHGCGSTVRIGQKQIREGSATCKACGAVFRLVNGPKIEAKIEAKIDAMVRRAFKGARRV